MKTQILSLFFLFLFIGIAEAEYKFPQTLIQYHAASIRNELNGERWEMKVSDRSIIITSLFDIRKHSRDVRILNSPGSQEKYVIKLSFKKGLTRKEYMALAQARAKYATILNFAGLRSKEEQASYSFLRDNPLPRYHLVGRKGERFSVYLSTIDDYRFRVSPLSSYAEAKGVIAVIDGIMRINPK